MIEAILTNALDERPILRRLKERYRRGTRHLLLVPDRFTLSYERAALGALGLKGSFDLDVCGFSRLADKLLADRLYKPLDKQSEILLLRKVIEDCRGELCCFNRSVRYQGFAEEIYAAIAQIRNSGVSTERLEAALPRLPERVAAKTKDIALIYRRYTERLREGVVDGTKKIEALAQVIDEGALAGTHVFVSDFLGFSGVEYEVLSAMMRTCPSVTVCLIDGGGANARIYPKDVLLRLQSLAEESGNRLTVSRLNKRLSADFSALADGLFGENTTPPSRGGSVELIVADDVRAEIKTCARRIDALIKREGARYREIAVVLCDPERYADPLADCFDSFGFRRFSDTREPLIAQVFPDFVFAALRAADGFRQEHVLRFAKQELLEADYDRVCLFENYCRKYAVDYSRFSAPFGIEDAAKDAAEEIRATVAARLRPLTVPARTAVEFADAVENFCREADCERAVARAAARRESCGDLRRSRLIKQSYERFLRIVTQSRRMLGSCRMERDEYARILAGAAAGVKLGVAPLTCDSIFVGTAEESRLENVKYLFVLGATAENFPVVHNDFGIVSERESKAWSEVGVYVAPDVRALNRREKLSLLMLLLKPSEKLIVSAAERDPQGRECALPSAFAEIADLTGAEVRRAPAADEDWLYACGAEGNALAELTDAVRAIRLGTLRPSDADYAALDVLYALACERYGAAYVDGLLDPAPPPAVLQTGSVAVGLTSPSRFEKYFNCPFKSFADDVLRAKPRKKAQLEASETGSLLHAIAERFFSEPDSCALDRAGVYARVAAITEEVFAAQPRYAEIAGEAIKAAVCRRASFMLAQLTDKMRASRFRPAYLEKRFEPDGFFGAVEVDGAVRLRGVIDRIDLCGDRAIVIDYKSKSALGFKPAEIFCGERVQLLYYNAALRQAGYRPSGIFYILMRDKLARADAPDTRFRYVGYAAADDPSELTDFDAGFASPDYKSPLFPIDKTSTAKGVVYGGVLSRADLDAWTDYTLDLTAKAAREMAEGYIKPSPVSFGGEPETCRYCDYRNVCRIDERPECVRRVAPLRADALCAIAEKAAERRRHGME